MQGLILPHTHFSRAMDKMLGYVGRCISWLWLFLLGVIVVNVSVRQLFNQGFIELEELQWHIYSIGFLIGLSYAYQLDAHVRVDVVSVKLRPRVQAWLELYGILLALLPFIIMVIWYGIPFVSLSFSLSEISQAPGGLPYRWLIKASLPLAFFLLLLAVLSRLSRLWIFLFSPEPINSPEPREKTL